MNFYTRINSPLGPLLLTGDGASITGLYMDTQEKVPDVQASWRLDKTRFTDARGQLEAYFAGELTSFDLPLSPTGTAFQQKVWQALKTIPYGTTVSYKTIAERIACPRGVRAVGLANGSNPIGIIIPCHRVIGANGKLTGYAGGLERKIWLLNHEASHKTFVLGA